MGAFRYDKPHKGAYQQARQAKCLTQRSIEDDNEVKNVRYSPKNDRAIRESKR